MDTPPQSERRGRRTRHHPEPGRAIPKRWAPPVVGDIPKLRREGMLPYFDRMRRELGDVFEVKLGPMSAVVINHPDAFERVLASHQRNWIKGKSYDIAREFFGASLVTMETEVWRPRRRLMQPYFHRAGLRTLLTTMVEVIERYFDALRERLPDGGTVDIHREMINLTLEVVCTALFGPGLTRSDELSPETLMSMVEVMDTSLTHPFPRWVPTAHNRRFKRVVREVDALIYTIIERAKAARQQGEGASTLLGMLLDTVDEDDQALTTEEVRNELLTLYIAGHETTALMLTWLFALLPDNSEVMPRLVQESDAVLGADRPTFEHLSELCYTRQVIDEVLRLRGPAPLLSRNAIEADNLCGFQIRPGQMLMLCFWGLHRHPEFWPDPERFDPERFTPERVAARDPWSYLPFSGGPRTCIGNNFALYEGQLIIATMMQRAQWEPVPDQTIETHLSGTLRPKQPVKVRVQWRD